MVTSWMNGNPQIPSFPQHQDPFQFPLLPPSLSEHKNITKLSGNITVKIHRQAKKFPQQSYGSGIRY